MKGRIVILSGPSGVGKDTVIDAWQKVNPLVQRVVAATTRDPRPGEVDGVDYHFLTSEKFLRRVDAGGFLEHKLVHSNYYGTPKASVDQLVDQGRIAILKIDVQGAEAVRPLRPEAVSVFLLPPSDSELERRIRGRGLDSEEVIQERLKNARQEIAEATRYDHQLVNDGVEQTVQKLQEIVRG